MAYVQNEEEIKKSLKNWKSIISKYKKKNHKKAIGQMVSSFLPFIALWVLMYFSIRISILLTVFLGIINAFFLVRIFIIQHDCGHNSFIKSKQISDIIGYVCSVFSFLPFKYWAITHAHHHTHNGQLETRKVGDMPTLTVNEFRAKNWLGKLRYKIFRSPIVIFVIAPVYYFIVTTKYPFLKFNNWKKTTVTLIKDNIVMIIPYIILGYLLGWKNFLLVQCTILFFFGIIAFWFFFIQHQHEFSYKKWKWKNDWDFVLSAIKGSTHIKLPRIMEWFTGNIGIHHIHHLNSRIPNYNLKRCFSENKILSKYVTTISVKDGMKMMFLKLWDEEQERMISFREYYQREKLRLS